MQAAVHGAAVEVALVTDALCGGEEAGEDATHDDPQDDECAHGDEPFLRALAADDLDAVLADLDRVGGHLELGHLDHDEGVCREVRRKTVRPCDGLRRSRSVCECCLGGLNQSVCRSMQNSNLATTAQNGPCILRCIG